MNKLLTRLLAALRFDFFANFINPRSAREKLLILGFGGLLLLSADYFLWFSPVLKSLTRTIPALSSVETELQNLRDDKKNEPEIRRRLERLETELRDKEKGMEAANQIPSLLENLSKLAGRSGVRITSLDPPEPSAGGPGKSYRSLPIQIKATAGTHELGRFLSSLETGETTFKVLDLKISQNAQNQKKHLIEMKVETYRRAGA